MATILLTWELGGGFGHLGALLPLASGLRERGHRVLAAVRDLPRAEKVFSGLGVPCLQAPLMLERKGSRIDPLRTFAHILHNCGFGDVDELRALVRAWQNLYDLVQPDLIVFEHCPMALLAARGREVRKVLIGTGFCCPPNTCPLPDLRPWLRSDPGQLRREEDLVLGNANRVLVGRGDVQLEGLCQLFQEVDETFLRTFAELDHYPSRKDARYCGAGWSAGGKSPVWPEGEGKKIFAYLKPFPALPRLLGVLRELRNPALVFVDGLDPVLRARWKSGTVRLEDERLDLAEVGRQCDLAILNGTHGTTASMLLAGKPTLQVPLYLEQALNGAAVARLGAGLSALPTRPEKIESQLRALLRSEGYAAAARRFAARYADYAVERQIDRMVQRSVELLPAIAVT